MYHLTALFTNPHFSFLFSFIIILFLRTLKSKLSIWGDCLRCSLASTTLLSLQSECWTFRDKLVYRDFVIIFFKGSEWNYVDSQFRKSQKYLQRHFLTAALNWRACDLYYWYYFFNLEELVFNFLIQWTKIMNNSCSV